MSDDDYLQRLTPDEIFTASARALLVRFFTYRGDNHQGERMELCVDLKTAWDNGIESTCAEMAYAKWCQRYWSGCGGHGVKDVGFDTEVRWARRPTYGMVVQPKDTGPVVLVDGRAPVYRIVGWMDADEAKRQGRLTKFGYLVRRSLLHRF